MKETMKIAMLGTLLAKKYAADLFRLLKAYQDISASEAASRLNLHVQTVQEFLEGLVELDLVSKSEILEGKRPYFRYQLTREELALSFELDEFLGAADKSNSKEGQIKIREKKNPGTQFIMARGGSYFSAVTVLVGKGRERKQRRINLTNTQGRFLYFLPFPDAVALPVDEIMQKGEIEEAYLPEINNLIEALEELKIIEVIRSK